MEVSNHKPLNESEKSECSICHEYSSLTPANLSRKTGKRLYRSWCISCEKKRKSKWVQENMESILEKTKAYQKENPEQVAETKRRWAEKNKDYHRAYKKQWRLDFPEKSRAQVSARRKRMRLQKPIWESYSALQTFYENCPEGFHVDHILPLKGKLVSGLHTITNLQYLPAVENMKKHNKFNLEEFNEIIR